jgi:hypothetical protein
VKSRKKSEREKETFFFDFGIRFESSGNQANGSGFGVNINFGIIDRCRGTWRSGGIR